MGDTATGERKIQRLIASDWIDSAESCRAMARRVTGSLPEDKPVVLLVDETEIKRRAQPADPPFMGLQG